MYSWICEFVMTVTHSSKIWCLLRVVPYSILWKNVYQMRKIRFYHFSVDSRLIFNVLIRKLFYTKHNNRTLVFCEGFSHACQACANCMQQRTLFVNKHIRVNYINNAAKHSTLFIFKLYNIQKLSILIFPYKLHVFMDTVLISKTYWLQMK